jgi:acetyl esterase/lipase
LKDASYRVSTYDVEYRRAGDVPLLAHIYQPEGVGPFPAVVDVHGGVWTTHDRFQNATIHAELASEGIVVAALDFRMPPAVRYPAPIAEINYGIRWLKANARTFGSDADLVGGLGTSSGGHQLMLNLLAPADPRYAALAGFPTMDAALGFAIVGWGVVDPLTRYDMAQERGLTRIVEAHEAYWPSRASMAEGNPHTMLERGGSRVLPPLLYLQGTNDDNLTPDMAERFVDAYRSAGGDAQLEVFDGEPHTFVTKTPDAASSVRARRCIVDFIKRVTAHA